MPLLNNKYVIWSIFLVLEHWQFVLNTVLQGPLVMHEATRGVLIAVACYALFKAERALGGKNIRKEGAQDDSGEVKTGTKKVENGVNAEKNE